MKIEDYTKISHKHHLYKEKNDSKKIKYFKGLTTRILLSIILLLATCIFIKLDEKNALKMSDLVFKDSLQFTTLNNWYKEHFGNLLPKTSTTSELVFSDTDLQTNSYTDYLDGVKIDVSTNSPISILNGGIVVFIGEKEGYGNTLIIQGNDGIDYWYGGITNVGVNLYDYLEKDTLIGSSKDNYIYLVLQENGEFLKYEEYITKNQN